MVFFKDVYSCNIDFYNFNMRYLFFFGIYFFILLLIIDYFCRKLLKNGIGEKEKSNF